MSLRELLGNRLQVGIRPGQEDTADRNLVLIMSSQANLATLATHRSDLAGTRSVQHLDILLHRLVVDIRRFIPGPTQGHIEHT